MTYFHGYCKRNTCAAKEHSIEWAYLTCADGEGGSAMAMRVYILGDAAAYQNYALAVERAGGIPCFGSSSAAALTAIDL